MVEDVVAVMVMVATVVVVVVVKAGGGDKITRKIVAAVVTADILRPDSLLSRLSQDNSEGERDSAGSRPAGGEGEITPSRLLLALIAF